MLNQIQWYLYHQYDVIGIGRQVSELSKAHQRVIRLQLCQLLMNKLYDNVLENLSFFLFLDTKNGQTQCHWYEAYSVNGENGKIMKHAYFSH